MSCNSYQSIIYTLTGSHSDLYQFSMSLLLTTCFHVHTSSILWILELSYHFASVLNSRYQEKPEQREWFRKLHPFAVIQPWKSGKDTCTILRHYNIQNPRWYLVSYHSSVILSIYHPALMLGQVLSIFKWNSALVKANIFSSLGQRQCFHKLLQIINAFINYMTCANTVRGIQGIAYSFRCDAVVMVIVFSSPPWLEK